MGLLPYGEAYSAAKKAATRALEIDETLAEGHAALATAALYGDWDWAAAKRELERAIELNPGSANAHRGYGNYLVLMDSSHEGVADLKRAVELDPLSAGRYFDLSYAYFHARQFDRALGELRKASALDPGRGHGWYLAVTLTEQGMYEDAIAEFRSLAQQGDSVGVLGHLGNAYARAGRTREARACVRELKELLDEQDIGEYEVALIYAGLGEGDAAFEWLDKAYDKRDKGLVYLKVDPPLDPLRSDPRFQGPAAPHEIPVVVSGGRNGLPAEAGRKRSYAPWMERTSSAEGSSEPRWP
jgi:tetratricopeptide (TPR) repeat protein